MSDNPKNNDWLWFAIPFVIIVTAIVLFVVLTDPGQESPFTYGQ